MKRPPTLILFWLFLPCFQSLSLGQDEARLASLEENALPLAQQYGLLRLQISPGYALTHVDGQVLDRNVWLISLSPGPHVITISKEGFKTEQREIVVQDGDRLTLNVNLNKH